METKSEHQEVEEVQGVCVTDHILIRDADTKEELVNQQGSMRNWGDNL